MGASYRLLRSPLVRPANPCDKVAEHVIADQIRMNAVSVHCRALLRILAQIDDFDAVGVRLPIARILKIIFIRVVD
jgi:hypothetical protein